MRIAAALAWYDEPPAFLDRCARSLAGVVDELVALDGAWRLQPDGQPYSPYEQVDSLRAACADVGLRLRDMTHPEVFE